MLQINVDARGLSCPQPVLMAKKEIDADSNLESITVIVDNEASMENVSRFLASKSFIVEVLSKNGGFELIGRLNRDSQNKQNQNSNSSNNLSHSQFSSDSKLSSDTAASDICDVHSSHSKEHKQKIMVFVSTDRMGFGDDELGKKLMVSFIKTIKEMGDELWKVVFVNNGVKLAVEESPVLQELLEYQSDGITIMVCGTCLTHFNLLDAKKVGETTNMLDIVTAMQLADKVIKI